jgi:hypothetical protein
MRTVRSFVAVLITASILAGVALWDPVYQGTPEAATSLAVAVSPPLEVAIFRPENFDKAAQFPILQTAITAAKEFAPQDGAVISIRQSRSRYILAFPQFPHKRSAPSPDEVDNLIRRTLDPDEAIRILRSNLGWQPTIKTLKGYMTRYGITAPWKRYDGNSGKMLRALLKRPRVEPRQVQLIMDNADNREQVLECLKRWFHWSLTPTEFQRYREKYGLRTPAHWPRAA